MTLQFTNFETLLKKYAVPSGYLVAYSGGLDSGVLLDLMHQVSVRTNIHLRAIHIHHGLQKEADQWVTHCQQQCNALDIPLTIIHLNIDPVKGESIEAIAREKRYQAFESILQKNELLLLAQHRDDQAETLMLQLLRGAGPEGLAAMPFYRPFAVGAMIRPLLGNSREEIEEYAHKNKLNWIDDPSNDHIKYDRNYLRHNVMPLLKERWPSYSKTLSRSANLCADASNIVRTQAAELLCQVQVDEPVRKGSSCHTHKLIDAGLLRPLSSQQQAIVIREWLRQQQFPMPSETQMEQLLSQMLDSSDQASPLVSWADVEVRRYRKHLYALKTPLTFDSSFESQWNINEPLMLPNILGYLVASEVQGEGICNSKIGREPLIVSFRHKAKKSCDNSLDSKAASQFLVKPSTIKKIMQQSSIPPWERKRVIVLSNKIGDLIALVGWWISPDYKVVGNDAGYDIHVITELCND